jgi:hypothetical protein
MKVPSHAVLVSPADDIAPDGTQVVCAVPVSQSDIWLIENFDPEVN